MGCLRLTVQGKFNLVHVRLNFGHGILNDNDNDDDDEDNECDFDDKGDTVNHHNGSLMLQPY